MVTDSLRTEAQFGTVMLSFCGERLSAPLKVVEHEKNNFSEIIKVDTSGGFELGARLAHHQTPYRLRYAGKKARRPG